MKQDKNNIVKFSDDTVICYEKDSITLKFSDAYVVVHHDKNDELTNCELLYYLEMAAFRVKSNNLSSNND